MPTIHDKIGFIAFRLTILHCVGSSQNTGCVYIGFFFPIPLMVILPITIRGNPNCSLCESQNSQQVVFTMYLITVLPILCLSIGTWLEQDKHWL